MRPIPADRPGRINPLVFLSVAVAFLACDAPTGTGRVRSLALTVPATELRPGFFMRVEARPLDEDGEVVEGTLVKWSTRTPGTLDVSSDGLMLALLPGEGIARATSGHITRDVHLDLVNPPIAQLTLDADTLRLPIPGASRQLHANPKDTKGIGIIGDTLTWTSSAPRIATVSATGLVVPVAVGHTVVTVSGDGVSSSVEVYVSAPPLANGPVITNVTPSIITPGQSVVVTGTGFRSNPAANTVLVDGVALNVTAATTTQLTISTPAAAVFPCEPTRAVAFQVGTVDGIGVSPVTLSVATARTLGVGQSVILTSANDARCNELIAAPGRYLVTLPNAARTLGAGSIALAVSGAATLAPVVMAGDLAGAAKRNTGAVSAARHAARTPDGAGWLRGRRDRRRDAAHLRLLEDERALMPAVSSLALAAPRGASILVPAPGAILSVRVPSIGQPNFCDSYTSIGARVVHVTDHLVFLEDTSSVAGGQATLAHQMDADYAAIGTELESRGWPIVATFGNALAMDSRLDDNGHVFLVFTPRMNQLAGGALLASVVNCDYFPRALFAASNVGEHVYAQVPTTLAGGMAAGTRARWRHEMRATLVHELKHVVAFSERYMRQQQLLEEKWLDEATARHAEELYGRAAYGTARYGNTDFSAQLACELRANDPAFPSCADAPRAIYPHLDGLWRFLDAPASLSPLGQSSADDFSFFGSAWALTRWLIDEDGPSESVFFTALTTSGQTGVTNLEARSGRAWDEMLPEWSLAMAAAGRGITPVSPLLRFPSWDLKSNYLGLCEVVGSCITERQSPFVRPYPLQPLLLEAGAFNAEFDAVSPGGFVALEIVASPAVARQLIELRGLNGTALPSSVRMGILRIQ